ncbi:MAG TPA: protease pro-enzyme activation domain-containing protein [Acidimicrobiales bacterium]|nr:protease pro-enzyme activation domain-containing protein [Acidimicrobiales bacterium]
MRGRRGRGTTVALALVVTLGPGSVAAGAAGASAASAARVTLGPATLLPAGARLAGPLAAARVLTVDLALRPGDQPGLGAFLAAVSTPGSPGYRHYLAPGEFAARFGPSPGAVAAVEGWLRGQGLAVTGSPAPTLLEARGTVGAVSGAFAVDLQAVVLAGGRSAFANTTPATVPATLAGIVTSVVGLSDVARLRPALVRSTLTGGGPRAAPAVLRAESPTACPAAAGLARPGGSLTADQVASAYGLSTLYGQGRTGAGITVALYELEPFSAPDVTTYQQCYGLANPVGTVNVDGGPPPGSPQSGEAALDIETVAGLAPGARLLVYQGPNAANGPLDTYAAIAAGDRAPVVSTSWGDCEATLGAMAVAEYPLFEQMAAQGQTVVAAAGDTGSEGCLLDHGQTQLAATDPAGQPYVTGVGGTTMPQVGPPTGETVWNNCAGSGQPAACAMEYSTGAGGGGISSLWAMPAWQQAAGNGTVNSFSSPVPCGAPASAYCREVPDVAADGDPATGFIFHFGGWVGGAGGTSASVLVWAALAADVDQGCANPVGFANPALYSLGSASTGYTDIVSGNNDFTSGNGGAYPATLGYDLASGWGTPRAETLVGALQPPGGCPSVTGLSATGSPVGGGGQLTITGISLGNAQAVTFGRNRPATIVSDSATQVTVVVPPAPGSLIVDVRVTTANGTSAATGADRFVYGTPPTGLGYWLGASDGGVFAFGNATYLGSMGGRHLNAPVLGLAAVPGRPGYWEVASDGGLFAFGDAGFSGSMGGKPLNAPVVGMATSPDGGGYWEVASDGGVFAFGGALFYGSAAGSPLNRPIAGIAPAPDDGGYWEVATDGGIFAYGDAGFFGSTGAIHLAAPIVAMAVS